jgi:hypothetical protein
MNREDAIGMLRLMGYEVVPVHTHSEGIAVTTYHATLNGRHLPLYAMSEEGMWKLLAHKYLGGTYTDHLTE